MDLIVVDWEQNWLKDCTRSNQDLRWASKVWIPWTQPWQKTGHLYIGEKDQKAVGMDLQV